MRSGSIPGRVRLRVGVVACAILVVVGAVAAQAQDRRTESRTYPASAFVIEYALEHPDQPGVAELMALEVELRVGRGGLLPPHPSAESVRFPLSDVPKGSRFYAAGLRHVSQQLLAVFEARGIGAVIVTFPQIEMSEGRDLRAPRESRLLVRIWTGRIESVATVADGDRFGTLDRDARTNHKTHDWIREGSPVQPGGPRGLLRVDAIEDYAFRLSRHPGRRVDAVLRPGALSGSTRVDYHVAESKPWIAYAEISNTGTEGTTRVRERFGFTHNQLTGNDDILRLDYVTGNFDEVHGVWGSYEVPTWHLPRLRWLVDGSYSEYDASEVGQGFGDFQGDQWHTRGQLQLNLLQVRELFVDLLAGARWRNVTKDDAAFGEAEDEFFLPEVGLRVMRHTQISSLALDVLYDTNVASIAGTDADDLDALGGLGTLDPDEDFSRVRWNGALSFFLEPAFRWRRWADPTTPASSTLAHEVLLTTRGQVSLGDRLAPQFQQIAGGLYSVRGYEQSVAAGDTVLIGTAEYRLHLARLLHPSADAPSIPVLGKVKIRPEHVYGRPDWDFIVKAFIDAARVLTVDRRSFEKHETLVSYGIGGELQFMRYLRARVDLGWPQERLSNGEGDSLQVHGSLTLMF